MRPTGIRFGLAGVALVFAAGCGPRDPWAEKVQASGAGGVAHWQGSLVEKLPVSDRQRVEAALQEIRLHIMAEREASGSAAIAEALGRRIHGRTGREVLQLGLEHRLERLRAEGAALQRAMEQNAMLQTRPGDTASENHLIDFHRKQAGRLERLREEILAAERELAPLLRVTGRRLREPPTTTPAVPPPPARDPARRPDV